MACAFNMSHCLTKEIIAKLSRFLGMKNDYFSANWWSMLNTEKRSFIKRRILVVLPQNSPDPSRENQIICVVQRTMVLSHFASCCIICTTKSRERTHSMKNFIRCIIGKHICCILPSFLCSMPQCTRNAVSVFTDTNWIASSTCVRETVA